MNTAELSQHVSATGGITSEIYRALENMARAKSPGAANYRVAYSTMPVCWGCDDADFVAIVGLVPFTAAELLTAGFEQAVADAQEIEIGLSARREELRATERAAQLASAKAGVESALGALVGRTLELPLRIEHDGYRHVFTRVDETSRFFIAESGMKNMGGYNMQPTVTLQCEDGQTAWGFIGNLIEVGSMKPGKVSVETQCDALLKFAL